MEGLGPSAGEPKPLGVVLASADPFAADAVACRLMGVDPAAIPHLRLGAERSYGLIDPGRIEVRPDDWKKWIRPFAPPPGNLAVEFEGVEILDKNSCSACQSTLLLFLKRYGNALGDYGGPEQTITFAIGSGHRKLPEGTICVGNCAAAYRDRGIFIPGCPPVASQILEALTGRPSVDGKDGRIEDDSKN